MRYDARQVGTGLAVTVMVSISVTALALARPESPATPSIEPSSHLSAPPRASESEPTPASAPRLHLGVAISGEQLRDRRVRDLLAAYRITSVTPEVAMKASYIHPEPQRFVWNEADAIVNYAQANGMRVRGHALVWHRDVPTWVSGLRTKAAARDALRGHIFRVMGRYRGRVAHWDVVNEALNDEGELRDSPWLALLGPEYVPLAFRYASEADPDAKLFYNEYGAESANDTAGGNRAKARGVERLVSDLQRRGIAIHGVGLEAHADGRYPGRGADIEANLRRLGRLGVATELTELDVVNRLGNDEQAARYAELGGACARVPTCTGVTVWGVDDGHTWRPGTEPLLFDADLRPKPAYSTLVGTLRR